MSTVLHPKGSQPPQVYWRRRAVVIGAAVLVVLLIAWIAWPKGSGSAAPAGPAVQPVVSPSASPVTPPASVSPSPSSSPSATGPVACDPGSVSLNVAGYQKVKQGAKQTFTVSIKNTADPCVLQVSAANFDVTVTSGTDRIWSTADCAKWVPTAKDVKLKQNQSYQFEVVWPLVRSKAECGTTKDLVKPGTYVGTATFGGAANARQVFVITGA